MFFSLGDFIKKDAEKFIAPAYPIKRELTEDENNAMIRYFVYSHSWSHIDAEGRIILGGGEDEEGRYYITEEDLKELTLNFKSEKTKAKTI
jgi:hypothetical protein